MTDTNTLRTKIGPTALTALMAVAALLGCTTHSQLTMTHGAAEKYGLEAADTLSDSRLPAPCYLTVGCPDMTGLRTTLIKNHIYEYPLREVIQVVFHQEIYKAFEPPQSADTSAFTLKTEVHVAELRIRGSRARFHIVLQYALKDPGGRILVGRQVEKSGRGRMTGGKDIPDVVYKTVAAAAAEIVRTLQEEPRVAMAVRKHAKENAAALAAATSPRPPAPYAAPTLLKPRRPEDAGVLESESLQQTLGRNRWRALLIGISDYSRSSLAGSLGSVPTNDVNQLGKLLNEDYGFDEVQILTDQKATRANILAALDHLSKNCDKDDNVFLYYAGHGHMWDHIGAWVTADAGSRYDCISNSDVTDRLKYCPAKRVLLISDSCFSGSFLTRGVDDRALNVRPKPMQTQESVEISGHLVANQRMSREVITSGNLTTVPNEGVGAYRGNSPFAAGLLTALKCVPKGGVIGSTDLYVELRANMQQVDANATDKARPQFNKMTGDSNGEFFLIRH